MREVRVTHPCPPGMPYHWRCLFRKFPGRALVLYPSPVTGLTCVTEDD